MSFVPPARKMRPASSTSRPSFLRFFALPCTAALALLCGAGQPLAAQANTASATATTLAITSAGATASTVASGSMVTLTATVTANGTPITRGQVSFCDATSTYCTDIHLLGTAQIIQSGSSAGSASLRFIPGVGTHSYKAVFAGTPNASPAYAASTSSASALTVTGTFPTTTTLASTGTGAQTSLTATVSALVNTQTPPAPSAAVNLSDSSSNDTLITSAPPTVPGAPSLAWQGSYTMQTLANGSAISVDVNGDGKPDLILPITSYSTPAIQVFLSDGDGTFTPAPASSFGSAGVSANSLASIQVGDFNNDGKIDVAANVFTSSGATELLILLGNGDGSFTAAPNGPAYTCQTLEYNCVGPVADFNGDGLLDMASIPDSANGSVVLLLGNGDGTFTPKQTNVIVPFGSALLVGGDLNNDGFPDLLQVTYPNGQLGSAESDVTPMLNHGDGTFTAQPAIDTQPGGPTLVAIGDFNGDGKSDLAVTNLNANLVFVVLGNGDGTFSAAPGSPLAGQSPANPVIADVNADGKPDLLVGNVDGPGSSSIFLGNGDGTFTPSAVVSSSLAGARDQITADFNGDGLPDVAYFTSNAPSFHVALTQLTQTATATFNNVSPLGTGTHQVVATYPGDSTYAASTSSPVALTAQQVTPTVSLSVPAQSVSTAQALPVTITVSAPQGDPTPTGNVTLTAGSYTSAATALTKGTATITVPAGTLAAGTANLTASYTGDGNYLTAQATGTATVVSPSFALTASAVTVLAGTSTGNTSTITVTPAGGFTGSITLTAALTSSPANPTYPPTFSFGTTSPVTVSGTGASTATLTITTTSPAICGVPTNQSRKAEGRGSLWLAAGSASFACVFLFGIPRRRRWTNLGVSLLLLLACSFGLTGCSGSNSGGGGKVTCNTATAGTTTGTYTITVTGSSGSLTQTGTVTLTVQ